MDWRGWRDASLLVKARWSYHKQYCRWGGPTSRGRANRWGGWWGSTYLGVNEHILWNKFRNYLSSSTSGPVLHLSANFSEQKCRFGNVSWKGSSVFKHDPLRLPRREFVEMEAISRPIRSAPWISRPSPSHSVSEMGKTERKKEGGSRLQSRGVLLRRSNADGSWKERLGSRGDPQGQVAWQWLVAPELRRHRVWTRIWKNDAGIINHA